MTWGVLDPIKWHFLILLVATSLISNQIMKKGYEDINLYKNLFLGTMMLRMMIVLGVILWYIFDTNEANPISLVLTTMCMYFTFLISGVVDATRRLNKMK